MYIKRHTEDTVKHKHDLDAFTLLDKIPTVKRGSGGVICLYDNLLTLKATIK